MWDRISRHPLWSAIIAGVVVLIIEGIAHSISSGLSSQPPTGAGTTSQGSEGGVSSNAPNSGGGISSNAPSPKASPLWQGSLLVNENGVDFDTTPPTPGPPGSEISYSTTPNSQLVTYGSYLAPWNKAGTPSESDCQNDTDSNSIEFNGSVDAPKVGMAFCLNNQTGHEVYFKVEDLTSNGMEIYAIVWDSQ